MKKPSSLPPIMLDFFSFDHSHKTQAIFIHFSCICLGGEFFLNCIVMFVNMGVPIALGWAPQILNTRAFFCSLSCTHLSRPVSAGLPFEIYIQYIHTRQACASSK